ncbi:N-acyl-D-amino-acid deacylase family protein [Pseudoalteromonas sp. SS15]|uniref:N-acyl-D-amino-acid deacylase family protein n=1 Tax=Pseudoalteromonas sp. SS15 TaxID=3139393 RepID=UPI003BA9D1DE
MKTNTLKLSTLVMLMALTGCANKPTFNADILLTGGLLISGDGSPAIAKQVAICEDKICGIFAPDSKHIKAKKNIDVSGKVIAPGFIDPHTHSLSDLKSSTRNSNLNYLTQGVTTVINGNDGGGPVDLNAIKHTLHANGIGTNVGLLVGHGSLRKKVMGKVARHATEKELLQMEALLETAMQQGALGLSSGLYYVPGSYADTNEVIRLAKVAAKYNGIYDTHIRDESSFSIGLIPAVQEAIDIAKAANIHLHLAHIKALGVDVWGQSTQIIDLIKSEQKQGVSISADQYPWLASGTKLHSALMPKWVMADNNAAFYDRLNDPSLQSRIDSELAENLRRRGGPSAILITKFHDKSLEGKTLEQVADEWGESAIDSTKKLVQMGQVRIASFNMSAVDVENFMQQDWVVTSSDGTDGHPRKYASFPRKLKDYVLAKKLMSLETFVQRSSANTAKYFNIKNRGLIKPNYFADIIVFNPEEVIINASFSNWAKLTQGMQYVIVNGSIAINDYKFTQSYSGKVIN